MTFGVTLKLLDLGRFHGFAYNYWLPNHCNVALDYLNEVLAWLSLLFLLNLSEFSLHYFFLPNSQS